MYSVLGVFPAAKSTEVELYDFMAIIVLREGKSNLNRY